MSNDNSRAKDVVFSDDISYLIDKTKPEFADLFIMMNEIELLASSSPIHLEWVEAEPYQNYKAYYKRYLSNPCDSTYLAALSKIMLFMVKADRSLLERTNTSSETVALIENFAAGLEVAEKLAAQDNKGL